MSDGNNTHKAKDLFSKRNRYKLSDGYAIKSTYLNEGILIGKMTNNDYPIVPKKEKLIGLDSISCVDARRITAFDFVRLAFDSMNLRFQDGVASGKVIPPPQGQTPLDIFKAHAGYMDPLENYRNYMNLFFTNTKTFLDNPVNNKKVYTFKAYIEQFFIVAKEIISSYPLLYGDFIVSKKNDQLSSALIIEIDDHVCDDDSYKTRYFYNHPSFSYINNLSVAFGFRIDKNIPWRFIADINSPQMRYYMKLCDLEYENYYSENTAQILKRYYNSPENDYNILLNLLYINYIDFLQKYPSIKEYDKSPCANINKGRIVSREADSKLDLSIIKYIFNEIIYFKSIFHDFHLTPEEMNILKNKTFSLLKSTGTKGAMMHLNSVFNTNNNMHGSINHTVTNLSLLERDENYTAGEIIRQNLKNARINNSKFR